jgi:hypothetical protein
MTEGITFSPTPIFYVVAGFLAGLILGWVIGFFDSNSRTAKKIEAAQKNAEIKIQEAEDKVRRTAEQAASQPRTQDDPGLLRLKNEAGRYTLEVDGAPVAGALAPERKKRLIDLLTIIRPFLEGGQPQPAPKPAAPPTMAAPHPPPAAVPPPKPDSHRVVPAEVAPVPPTLGAALTPKKPAEEKPLSSLSIVGQIDSVLQARLINTPLEGMGIRLHESPEGAVEVFVGLQKFGSVDEVKDPSVKAAIRAAIAEWEEKYTPGA